ncbi:kinase-like domain-containing protein, partial [Lyophyllum atratum]
LFRFGLPFVLKATHRIQSTEADALSYLNTQFQGPHRLPIPRLYDSLVTDNCTYTLMSRIPGDTLLSVHRDMTDAELDVICHEVEDVMRRVWSLQQPAHFERRVCISASGHGILTVESHYESLAGPYRSSTEYYHINTGVWKDVDHFLTTVTPLSPYGDPRDVFEADPLVFTHTDLRMYNVMVKDGHLTGIIDWELSAWLP